MRLNAMLLILVVAGGSLAATPSLAAPQTQQENAAARALFVEGRDLWDDGKFGEAEKKFREALTKYPKAEQSDRTAYYLITTLVKLGRAADARTEIDKFNKTYPQSAWRSDVEEKRLSLNSPFSINSLFPVTVSSAAAPFTLNGREWEPLHNIVVRTGDGHIILGNASLEQEALRALLQANPDRGIELARERLKVDPSDPAVISNLSMIANSTSSQALPFLLNLAGSSASPNARSQAMFWMGRRNNGDRQAMVRALVEMMSSSRTRETDSAVAETLGRFNVSERREALDRIVEGKTPETVALLERIYRSSISAQLRQQIAQSTGQVPDGKALALLTEIARNDADLSVRRAALQALAGRTDSVKALEDILRSLPPTPDK